MSFTKTASTLAIGTMLGFGVFYGVEKYNDLRVEANFQKTLENMEESKVDLQIIADSLQSKINEYSSYTVSKSEATIKCFNEYKEGVKYAKNIFTGEILKNPFNKDKDWVLCEPTIWTYAQAKASFFHDIDFLGTSVKVKDNKIAIDIKYPYLNESSISVDMKTFEELEAETVDGKTYKNKMNNDATLLDMEHNMDRGNNSSIKTNARTAWQIKFIEEAPNKINEMYANDENLKSKLESDTISSVSNLLNTLLVDTLKDLDIVNEDVELVVNMINE